LAAITDPIHQSSLKSDSEGDREVYMVGQEEEPPEKTVEEIQLEAKEKIAQAGMLKGERSTITRRTTRGHLMMSLGMMLL
jgi:hypothetical protein